MPSRRRPKSPPPRPLTDVERFAKSLRDSEEADRLAQQAVVDRRHEQERLKLEAADRAARLQRAQAAHQRAVEMVKDAKRTGKGAADADVAWREAKAELLELETGKRPAWAAKPAEPPDSSAIDSTEATEESVGEPDGVVEIDAD